METGLDTGLQMIGTAAAVAGTYFAYRQYRLSRDARPTGRAAGEEDGNVEHFACLPYPQVGDLFYGYLMAAFGIGMMVWTLLDRDPELSAREFTVRRRFPNTHFVRVPWANIDHIAIITSPGATTRWSHGCRKAAGSPPGCLGLLL
ncbi:hypothetical protein [Glycomyces sp. NPDC048151]|uniref:hypothetical protein n=1 Tax=Glycomyces sp. NPDC048151 TaxID=3364002 RepID=UPI00371F769E